MTYNFLSLINRFKPRKFREFSGGGGGLHTYLLQSQCLTELKCQTDPVIS